MDPERRREICRKGGKAAHAQGKAHTWTPEEAKLAGSKGGKAAQQLRMKKELLGATDTCPETDTAAQ
jgi:general stress protein YciG